MQIQLKQKEIELALRGYIVKQGINLVGRTLTITFTAGRKDSGLSADIIIEDVAIPGFSQEDEYDEPTVEQPAQEEPVAPPLVITQQDVPAKVQEPVEHPKPEIKAEAPTEATAPEREFVSPFGEEAKPAVVDPVTHAATKVSLFN